jgi:aminoglycoside 6-adenylyltransferase
MRQTLLDAIIRFAETCDAVTALILIGSQARDENKADEFSDTDLILVVTDAGPFLQSDSWLGEIGGYHVSFTEPTIGGQMERRVLFDGAQDVDFVIVGTDAAAQTLKTGDAQQILSRGYKVLAAKRGFAVPPIPHAIRSAFRPAAEAEFGNLVQDFWYHTVWATKKLMRRELWSAKFCVDGYLKQKLLWMIEQHEHLVRHTEQDTWYGGRFIERWADADTLRGLQTAFAHFDPKDIAKALTETMTLFRRLATQVAAACGFIYPAHTDDYATAWVFSRLGPLLEPKEGEAP